jgi:hypothetical protein
VSPLEQLLDRYKSCHLFIILNSPAFAPEPPRLTPEVQSTHAAACPICSAEIQVRTEPVLVEWRSFYKGEMSVGEWIWSQNSERRHLTEDQLTMVRLMVRPTRPSPSEALLNFN